MGARFLSIGRMLAVLACLTSTQTRACWLSAEQNIWVEGDSIAIEHTANFCVGAGSACMQMGFSNVRVDGNEIVWDVEYYFLTLPSFQCTRIDTMYVEVLPGSYNVIVNSFDYPFGYDQPIALQESDTSNFIQVYRDDSPVNSSSFSVFPNPSEGTIKVHSPFEISNPELLLCSLDGMVLRSTPIVSGITNVIELDVSSGTYILFIKGEGELRKHTIVVL